MSTLTFNYSEWTYWEPYDTANNYFGNQKVTFDGPNKLILVNEGEITLNVQQDIYSNWKEWTTQRDNSKYPEAITATGGDPITSTTSLGITYFLENGWRIQPYIGNYILDIDGNIYTREVGENPVNPTSGVSVSLTRSNIVDLIFVQSDLSNVQTSVDSIYSEITGNLTSNVASARDHAKAANLQTQK